MTFFAPISPTKPPTVVIFRHATRSISAIEDPPLNREGLAQAERLVQMVFPHGSLPQPTRLWTSPKLRAKQTFAAVAHSLSLDPLVEPLLDERQSAESRADFQTRIRKTVAAIEASTGPGTCLYVCTHFDWLEDAMVLLPSQMSETETAMSFATAEYRIFEIEDGLWKLVGRGYTD